MEGKPKMFGKVTSLIGMMKTLLGFKSESDIPIDAENKKLNFTDEQIEKLKAATGGKFTEDMIAAVNDEIKAFLDKDMGLKAAQDELEAIIKEKELRKQALDEGKQQGEAEDTLAQKLQLLNDAHTEEKKKREELEAQVALLVKEPETDNPAAVINKTGNNTMKHSGTHLFATGKNYDAFEKRPWNMRYRDGGAKATDFNDDSNIPTLKDDIEHFVRENPSEINSLFNDFDGLPAEWSRRTGVIDRVADGFVIAAEIVQGRQKGWSPKNRFKFSVEEGKIFRKKIDITFSGYELQEIENTWLRIKNSDGSHPWKMSFIGFLLSELVKQQKVDGRTAQINGIYVETPDGDGNAGASVNSQNGLLFLWWYYRDVMKQYRPFTSGALLGGLPTPSNIVDYVEEMILSIPEDYRKMQGLEIQLSDKWMKAYRKRAVEGYNFYFNTDEGKKEYSKDYPIDRPNFKFQVLKDMTKTDFIGITFSKNVQILDYIVSEKNQFTTTMEKRDINLFADYREGIRFIYVGNEIAAGEPKQFEVQYLWSNNAPIFSDEVFVPAFDDKTGILKMNYPAIEIDEKWVTDISDIKGNLVPGQIVRIKGNPSLAGVKNLKDNAKFDINGDYALNTGGMITLFVNEDKTLTEIERTTDAPTVAETAIEFNITTIDANEGSEFKYTGDTDSLDDILNGVEGKSIKIYGSNTVDAVFTITTTGAIKVSADAALASSADYVQLTLVAGYWRDTKRVIA